MTYYQSTCYHLQPRERRFATRSRGFKRLIVLLAERLGPNGTIAVGAVLFAAFLGWATLRIIKRPQRLVWGPAVA
ncbi:MAG: hypothetical protein IRY99_18595 [Isosphaeraceae bacterium]|nr:hypothetical protein [Isosphaeraceae bacterium]